MENPLRRYWELRLEETAGALRANGFEAVVVPDATAAREVVVDRILAETAPKSVSWGGSMTFSGSGLYDALRERRDLEVLDTFDKSLSPAESRELRRRALTVDLFVTGTNAVTETGVLVNLDMWGNRVAAITFGPRHVVILAGRNKVVADLDEALFRVKNVAAPANAIRLDKKTPCVPTGRCQDCNSPDRICNYWTITEKSFPKGRIRVVLINADLGL
jgi:L-lactate utilization protein LutB